MEVFFVFLIPMVLAEQILSVYDQAPYFPTRDFPINPGEVSIAVLGTSGNPPQAPLLKGNGQSRFALYCLLPSRCHLSEWREGTVVIILTGTS